MQRQDNYEAMEVNAYRTECEEYLLCDHEHCNALQCDVCRKQSPVLWLSKEELAAFLMCQESFQIPLLLNLGLQRETCNTALSQ